MTPGVDRLSVDRNGNLHIEGCIVFTNQATVPANIPGHTIVYSDNAGALSVIDAAGAVNEVINWSTVPADNGLLAWSTDPTNAGGATILPTSGTIQLNRVDLNATGLITNAHIAITTAGNTLMSGQNYLGIYDANGVRVAVSGDLTTAFGSAGLVTAALTSPVRLASGRYYVAILSNGSVLPTLARSSTITANNINLTNIGLAAGTARLLSGPAAQTSLPTTIALASQSMNVAASWWVALS